MAFPHHLPTDLLPVAIRVTPRFPDKYAGHVFQPTHPEPQNIPRQTINNRLWSLSRLKKLAGFSASPSSQPRNQFLGAHHQFVKPAGIHAAQGHPER
jgi:hypothetical protein